jgi:hypothetical protein
MVLALTSIPRLPLVHATAAVLPGRMWRWAAIVYRASTHNDSFSLVGAAAVSSPTGLCCSSDAILKISATHICEFKAVRRRQRWVPNSQRKATLDSST